MTTPNIASRKGFYFELKAGRKYLWCACGRSKKQPFCDGSHVGTDFLPVAYDAERDEEVIFCGCKHTATKPFCDGTHTNLPGGYVTDDPGSLENRKIEAVVADTGPIVRLDGQCFVFSTTRAALKTVGAMRYCPVVTPARGARFQSQFYAEIESGSSTPILSADDRHTVLFVYEGDGRIEICGRWLSLAKRSGVYIRPSEAYRIENTGGSTLKVFISNHAGSEELVWRDAMPTGFEAAHSRRIAEIDVAERHKLAERSYQLLISREHGSTAMTQFIGNIPQSKAEPHRHLYEEVLFFLNGAGTVWTERRKTVVGAGDVLFLPQKQLHSVQCTSVGGFDIVGLICPGDNPAISY